MRPIVAVLIAALVLAGTATAATPRERALQRQVKTLKASNVRQAATIRSLRTERDSLKRERDEITVQRDAWLAEALRLRQYIVSSVGDLATAWRGDNNPKTDVSYYEAGNYWSYTFTWCGSC